MTSKFSEFWAVVKTHVSAKFHQAECSGSWAIVLTERKTKTIQSVATAQRIITCRSVLKRTMDYGCKLINNSLTSGRPSLKFLGGTAPWRALCRPRAYNGGLGAEPRAESRGRAPGQGVRGAKPPEAETFLAFGRPLEAANLSTFLKFRI